MLILICIFSPIMDLVNVSWIVFLLILKGFEHYSIILIPIEWQFYLWNFRYCVFCAIQSFLNACLHLLCNGASLDNNWFRPAMAHQENDISTQPACPRSSQSLVQAFSLFNAFPHFLIVISLGRNYYWPSIHHDASYMHPVSYPRPRPSRSRQIRWA